LKALVQKIIKSIVNIFIPLPIPQGKEYLEKILGSKYDIKFIQIGSNDGKSGDPLRNHIIKNNWKGILIEPVHYIYEKLKENYIGYHERLIFVNKAVANDNNPLKFYRLQESSNPHLPEWYDQLGTFDKKTLLKHKNEIPNFDKLLVEEEIGVISIQELVKTYHFDDVNLIHIDTEGFDYEILKLIPFKDISVEILLFERKHLSKLKFLKACLLLHKNNFTLYNIHEDTLGIRQV